MEGLIDHLYWHIYQAKTNFICIETFIMSKGSRKKAFFSVPATKRGEGIRAWPLRKFFFF